MATNVTTAVFGEGCNTATASPSLAQWDKGQVLQISGVDLPDAYQVEFSTVYTRNAIPMIGNASGVQVPNELLQRSAPITACIVLHGATDSRETEYWVTIHITPRKPPETTTPDPEQEDALDQAIAALEAGAAKAEAAAEAIQDMNVEAETLAEGSPASVEKTVDPETGAVTLNFGLPKGEKGNPGTPGQDGTTPNFRIGTVTTLPPESPAEATITGTPAQPVLNLGIPQGEKGEPGGGSGTSDYTQLSNKPQINGHTLDGNQSADDLGLGTYSKPASGIPKTDLASDVQASLGKADTALQTAPVTSVAGKTGAVQLNAGDVGFNSSEEYNEGTVGAKLSALNRQLNDETTGLDTKAPVILETASGAIASFSDGADSMPIKKLVAQIEPVQDLHGYDAPWPAGGNKNLCNGIGYAGSISNNIPTLYTRTSITSPYANQNAFSGVCFYAPVKSGKTYAISSDATGAESNIYYGVYASLDDILNSNKVLQNGQANPSFTSEHDGYVVFMRYNNAGTTITWTYAQVEEGSTATDFVPYENICPISGHTGAEIEQAGKNLLNPNDPDYGNYTITANGEYLNDPTRISSGYIKVNSDKLYVYGIEKGSTNYTFGFAGIAFYDDNKTYISRQHVNDRNAPFEVSVPSAAVFFRYFEEFSVYPTPVTPNIFNVTHRQIEYGSTPHAYTPYTGNQISVNWEDEAGTVYGGILTLNPDRTGTLVVDRGIITKAWSEFTNKITQTDYIEGRIANIPVNLDNRAITISDKLKYNTIATSSCFYISGTGYIRAFVPLTVEDTDTFTFVYPLATPTTFQLTAEQVSGILSTLYGTNNIWADTGDVEVTYPCDTRLYIDNKITQAIANALNS